jgi:hypothetical protein
VIVVRSNKSFNADYALGAGAILDDDRLSPACGQCVSKSA